MKILIIEKDELVFNILKRKLEEQGYEIVTENDQYDLAIIEEKELGRVKNNIPIIMIFNSKQPIKVEKAKQQGIKDFIFKAEFDIVEAVLKVKRLEK